MMPDTVIYHGGCKDGFCAAWVFHDRYPDATFVPASYGGGPPPDVTDKSVVIVDFSYDRETLEKMYEQARVLRVLDHHKSAEEALRGLPYCTFDMNRSGAGLAWDYLHDRPRPWIVDYVEDRDLWRWALPDSRQVNALIQTLPYNFEDWHHAVEGGLEEAVRLGTFLEKAFEARNEVLIGQMMSTFDLDEYEDVPVINAPTEGISELMEMMMVKTRSPICAAWRLRADGTVSVSLRSRGDLDVSVLAKQYGGGGHRNSAGFELTGERAMNFLEAIVLGSE